MGGNYLLNSSLKSLLKGLVLLWRLSSRPLHDLMLSVELLAFGLASQVLRRIFVLSGDELLLLGEQATNGLLEIQLLNRHIIDINDLDRLKRLLPQPVLFLPLVHFRHRYLFQLLFDIAFTAFDAPTDVLE